ncbi:MAG: hypothetical protein U9Q38_07065 [Thermodesulfobacteriota bacterium]|nr:hypothetical protein [Thermodesulfobacteriota bacterium]
MRPAITKESVEFSKQAEGFIGDMAILRGEELHEYKLGLKKPLARCAVRASQEAEEELLSSTKSMTLVKPKKLHKASYKARRARRARR